MCVVILVGWFPVAKLLVILSGGSFDLWSIQLCSRGSFTAISLCQWERWTWYLVVLALYLSDKWDWSSLNMLKTTCDFSVHSLYSLPPFCRSSELRKLALSLACELQMCVCVCLCLHFGFLWRNSYLYVVKFINLFFYGFCVLYQRPFSFLKYKNSFNFFSLFCWYTFML